MKDHVVLQEELNFEKRTSEKMTDLLEQAAKKNGWQLYKLIEESHDGPPFIFIGYS
jgi:hypothetical protein